jgi:hypothetical protein
MPLSLWYFIKRHENDKTTKNLGLLPVSSSGVDHGSLCLLESDDDAAVNVTVDALQNTSSLISNIKRTLMESLSRTRHVACSDSDLTVIGRQ